MLKLFEVKEGVDDKHLKDFDNFYECTEYADSLKDVKFFKILDDDKGKSYKHILIGMRIHKDEIIWRIKRNKKRSRDNWFYRYLRKISSLV